MDKNRIKDYIIATSLVDEKTTITKSIVKGLVVGILVIALLIGLLFFVAIVANIANTASRVAFIIANVLMVVNFIISFRIWKRKISTWRNQNNKKKEVSGQISKPIISGGVCVGMFVAHQMTRHGSDITQMIFGFTLIFILLMLAVHFYVVEVYKLYLLNKYCPELKNQTNSKPFRK